MTSASSSGLSDSWIINHADEADISWDDEPDDSDAGVPVPGRVASRAIEVRTRYLRSPPATPEPRLIMPSIDHEPLPTKGHSAGAKGRSRQQASARKSTKSTERTANGSGPPPQDESGRTTQQVSKLLSTAGGYMIDILGTTLKTLKTPIAWVISAYLFVGLLVLVKNLYTYSFYAALSPVCRIPGISLLHLPICQHSSPAFDSPPTVSPGASAAVEFDSLMHAQSRFESILAESASGVSLPLDMKRSETSIRDLRQVVRLSHLASRNELVLEFDGFIDTARTASYDLQKFNSHVGRGVDIVLSTARWTQRVLDDMAVKHSPRGIVPSFINDVILAPFRPVPFTEAQLLDQYIQHTRIVSDEIDKLIDEAQALLLVLQNLEDRLEVIHAIALRDNIAAQVSKDEVLSQLWTLLGGNRAQLGKYNNQLRLLRQVGEYRKVAWAHVSGTILQLQAMGAELEELRTRVGSAELLRDHREIPLSLHIESISLGVERLEAGRKRARELERRHVRRVIDAADDGVDGPLLVDG